ncbi:hypothetical protein CELD12_15870 [Cellulomonas sp. NTE-D12]|nr:hypothetical protein CELD12_15870 [Cellulomonas sp. NTE-D12]
MPLIAGLNVAVIDAVGLCTSTVEADELNVTVPLHGIGSAASAAGAATVPVTINAKVAMTAPTNRPQPRRT